MINTHTLTCAHCGSAEFTRVGPNEYRCNRCESVTLVEERRRRPVGAVVAVNAAAAPRVEFSVDCRRGGWRVGAVVRRLYGVFGSRGKSSSPTVPAATTSFRQPVDSNKIKIEPLRKVYTADGYGQYLIGRLRNESDSVIPGPRLSATLYADQNKLDTHTTGVAANYLQPGEYTVFKFRLRDDVAFSRYTVNSDQLYPAQVKPRALLGVSKNQLINNGENLQFIGVINNPGKAAAGRVHVNVMLYDASQQLIGFGDGAPQSATLQPGEQTAFQINCEMFGREPVAAYDYLIESERQS